MQAQDMPMLMAKEGSLAGQDWTLDRDVLIIGRGSECDIVLSERPVSRLHARIERRNQGYLLIDMGSKNGTYVGINRVKMVFGNSPTTNKS